MDDEKKAAPGWSEGIDQLWANLFGGSISCVLSRYLFVQSIRIEANSQYNNDHVYVI